MSDAKKEILDSDDVLRQLKFMLSLIVNNEYINSTYKTGLYNGLEMAISTIENRDPNLKDVNVVNP